MTTDNVSDVQNQAAAIPVVEKEPQMTSSPEPVTGVTTEVSDEFSVDSVFEEPNLSSPTDVSLINEDAEEQQEIQALKPNSLHEYPVFGPSPDAAPEKLALPPTDEKTIRERLSAMPNMDVMLTPEQQRWAGVIRDSIPMMPISGIYDRRLDQEGSAFAQSYRYNGIELKGSSPSFKKIAGVEELQAERAILQLVTHMGVGGFFRAPLWASGFWVMFKPATESELIELNRILYADDVTLGRWSFGLALSNTVSYTTDRILEFAIRHVYNTSVKPEELPLEKLRDWIAPQDIASFIWGFLCANYPSGYHYERPCIHNPSKCNHVVEDVINMTKLQNTDFNALTDWQKQHMSSMATGVKTLESLKRYREEMKTSQKRRIIINQGSEHELAITLRTPTTTEYVEHGYRWVSSIVDSINSTLSKDATVEERNAEINMIGKATTLCQYSHWIENIDLGTFTTQETSIDEESYRRISGVMIEDSLKNLSSIDGVREEILTKIKEYISDSTVSVIGIPAYDCPMCGQAQEPNPPKYPRHVNIVPIDMLQVFFVLLSRKLERIAARN